MAYGFAALRHLSFASLGLGLFLLCPTVLAETAAEARPNILFILTDDQRWDALGVVQRERGDQARFPWFQTPNLDRLAAEGMRFRSAFVTCSLCAPSRAVFLTGRYNHLNGVANNFTPFPTNNLTWATELRGAGYATAYIGKWHMDSQRGRRPGFDFSASFIGHARYQDAPFEINGVTTDTKGWVDDVSTDYAIEFIHQNKNKPWAMVVGFKTPHGPCEPPLRWAGKFSDGWLNPTPNLMNPAPYVAEKNLRQPAPAPYGPPGALEANLDYFRCLGAMDENVGRLLKVLDEMTLAANTIVVFASDNGFYLREHGLGDKRSAYDESLRIPLLVRYPALVPQGRVEDSLALNLDFAPTVLDLAGLPVPSTMQGRSWRPLLEGKPVAWRRSFFYEYFWEQQQGGSPPSMTAVRTANAKLIRYQDHAGWTELFDLAKDPYETRNLYGEPAAWALRAELEAEYERQTQAAGYVWPAYASDPAKWQPAPPLNAWVLDYRFNQDTGDKVVDASGKGNHGTADHAPLATGRNGAKVRRFDGHGCIAVPKTSSLNPAVSRWTVEATFKANLPDGVVVAHGGASNGYCLTLENGKLVFTVVASRMASRVISPARVIDEWTTAIVRYDAGGLTLAINGQLTGPVRLKSAMTREPNDGLQIGADLGSPVIGSEPPSFSGLIESVRIRSGGAP